CLLSGQHMAELEGRLLAAGWVSQCLRARSLRQDLVNFRSYAQVGSALLLLEGRTMLDRINRSDLPSEGASAIERRRLAERASARLLEDSISLLGSTSSNDHSSNTQENAAQGRLAERPVQYAQAPGARVISDETNGEYRTRQYSDGTWVTTSPRYENIS